MGRINENFLNGLFAPRQPGGEQPLAGGSGFFGNSAVYLQTNQRLNQAARFGANGENESAADDAAKETFWVGKSADAKKIGENLLRENFGFEEIDIQAYKTLYGDFTVFDEKQCAINGKAGKSCAAATPEQIQKWRASADGKKVSVILPESTVKFLRDFRQQRLIERRVMEIGDLSTRERLESSLKTAVTKSGNERAAAFTDLRNLLEEASPDGKTAAGIIKLVANLPENRENPFARILLAKIELKEVYSGKNAMLNPNDAAAIEQRVNRAVDLASGYNDATKTRDPKKAVSRVEAQALNEEAARLADQFGKPSDARFRTLLARFYAVDDAERNKYEAMRFPQTATLPRIKDSSGYSMSATPEATRALEQYRRENPPPDDVVKKDLSEDPQKREWKTTERTNGKGGIKTEAYRQFQQEGSLKPTGVEELKDSIHLN